MGTLVDTGTDHVDIRHIVDGVAAGGILASIAGYLPQIAVVLAILWYLMQMYDWVKKKITARKFRTRRCTDK